MNGDNFEEPSWLLNEQSTKFGSKGNYLSSFYLYFWIVWALKASRPCHSFQWYTDKKQSLSLAAKDSKFLITKSSDKRLCRYWLSLDTNPTSSTKTLVRDRYQVQLSHQQRDSNTQPFMRNWSILTNWTNLWWRFLFLHELMHLLLPFLVHNNHTNMRWDQDNSVLEVRN